MATYVTKKCPKCGAVYARDSYAHRPSKANRTKYGSPLKVCGKCGCVFKDDEYREIAIDGIRNVDTSVISPYSILFGVIGLLVCAAMISYNMPLGYTAFAFLIFEFSALSDILSYPKRMKRMAIESVASEKRLSNQSYVQALQSMGYFIPGRFLYPSSGPSDVPQSPDEDPVAAKQASLYDKQKFIIILAVYVAAVLALVGLFAGKSISRKNLREWQDKMEAASLFDVSPEAGTKMVVYEQDRSPNGGHSYQKHYLSSEMVAKEPDEAGYIVVIDYDFVVTGSYGAGITGIGTNAYRADTVMRLYDRHTGEYLFDVEVLRGGTPPTSIKSTRSYGVGKIADKYDIQSVISRWASDLK